METYTLTDAEVDLYDSGNDEKVSELSRSLRNRFGEIAGGRPVTIEVLHPDGFVVEQFARSAMQSTYDDALSMLSPADKARHLEADIEGHQVLWDMSGGEGHNWVLASAASMPADIRQEIACEIIDGKVSECVDYVASTGDHYRWS